MSTKLLIMSAYAISSLILGFGQISRGTGKDSIKGLGNLVVIVTFASSFYFLTIKESIFVALIWFLIIMPVAGIIMAYLEGVLYKDYLAGSNRVSESARYARIIEEEINNPK